MANVRWTYLFMMLNSAVSVNNFTHRHWRLITDVCHSGSTNIWAFTLVGAYDKSVLVWANQSFIPKRVPAAGNCRHENTSSWAAIQTDSIQGNVEGPLFGGYEMDVHFHQSVPTAGFQWHALGEIYGWYVKFRYPMTSAYDKNDLALFSIKTWLTIYW